LTKLTGNRDIEDSLERLDKLTQEEARLASAELLKMTHSVEGKVMEVDDRVKGVEGRVRGDVQDIRDKVQDVDDRVQGVDDKLDQASRSLSLYSLVIIPSAQQASQGPSSEIIFYVGFRRQIHPLIITSHTKLITTGRLNGSFEAVYSVSGNPLAPSCGYMENVRCLWPSPCVYH
jgi:predicted nuclease with TOPRIM domain